MKYVTCHYNKNYNKNNTTGYVICMYMIYMERKCIDGGFMNSLKRFKAVIL